MNNFKNLNYPENSGPGPSIDNNQKNDLVVDNTFYFFKKKEKFIKVDIDDIYYIKAESNYTCAITEEENYLSSMNLGEMEEQFTNSNFMRVHRSYIVNLSKLTSLDLTNYKLFIGSFEIPFSRTLKGELSKKFNLIR